MALILIKLIYAVLLIALARRAPGSLQLVRLPWLNNTHLALWGAITLLLLSVLVDIAVAVDFAYYQGRHAARVVGAANMVTVCLLGWASVMAGRSMSTTGQASDAIGISDDVSALSNVETNIETDIDSHHRPEQFSVADVDNSTDENAQLLKRLNHLLVEQRLFADTELNLQKLARKAGVPTRAVSRAINDQTGNNVSQWVNVARVDAACELLQNSDISITHAMHEVGFLTKSNFNREFRRLKGCSPSEWRAEHS